MHLSPDAMATVAVHDPEAAPIADLGRPCAPLDRMRDVRHRLPLIIAAIPASSDSWSRGKRFVGRVQGADSEGDRCIAVPALQHGAAIDGHQVPGCQYFGGGRDAMNNRSLIDEQMDAGVTW